MGKFVDLTGKRFGRLIVIEKSDKIIYPNGKTSVTWLCRCDCGENVIVESKSLKSGNTKSCGCFRKEHSSEKFKKHNMYGTRIYGIWAQMVQRCTNKKSDSRGIYIKRGIKICKEWRESPEEFIKWSMENGYEDTLTIDRINNDKGYSPENCRWVNYETQANNKRNTIYIEYNGKKQTLREWCDELELPYNTIRNRYKKKWETERMFTQPIRKW